MEFAEGVFLETVVQVITVKSGLIAAVKEWMKEQKMVIQL